MARVLVTGVGGPSGSSLARQLMGRGHWVLGVDMQRARSGDADVISVVSPSSAPGYLWELRGLVANYGIDVIIPTVREELVLMSDARVDFAPGVEVLVAEPAPVRTAHDKYLTMTCLASAGVSVPRFGLPGSLGSAHQAMDQLGGPLVIKSRVSHDRRGGRLVERTSDAGAQAARIWADLDDSWVVQRYAPGTDYAAVVLRSGLTHEQDHLVAVLEKTQFRAARRSTSPLVKSSKPSTDPDLAHLALSAAAALGLSGPVGVNIRRLRDGTPVVLSVEARFSAYSGYVPKLLDAVMGHYGKDELVGRIRGGSRQGQG